MRFENLWEGRSLVYIDKNEYMALFQLVENINEIFNAREKYYFQNLHQENPVHFAPYGVYFVDQNLKMFSESKHRLMPFFRITLLVTLIRIGWRIFRRVLNICYCKRSSGKSKHHSMINSKKESYLPFVKGST